MGLHLFTRMIVVLSTLVVGFIYGGFESGLLSLEDISGPVKFYGLGNYLPACFGGNVSNVFFFLGIPHKYDCRYQLRVETLKKRFPVGTKTKELLSKLGRPNQIRKYKRCGKPGELWVYEVPDIWIEIKDGLLTEVCDDHWH